MIRVADRGTLSPTSGTVFQDFGNPVVDGNSVIFHGESGTTEGLYQFDGTNITTLVDTTTPAPGGGVFNFIDPYSVAADNGSVAFIAKTNLSAETGVYLLADGQTRLIANGNTLIPGGTGDFIKFEEVSLSQRTVAFKARGDFGQWGIYVGSGGVVETVVNAQTQLDIGSLNKFTTIGREALDRNQLAFYARRANGTEALYVATIPEPTSAALLAVGGLAVLRRRVG